MLLTRTTLDDSSPEATVHEKASIPIVHRLSELRRTDNRLYSHCANYAEHKYGFARAQRRVQHDWFIDSNRSRSRITASVPLL
jgi:hypothetical protein